jgi:hypothetical protein
MLYLLLLSFLSLAPTETPANVSAEETRLLETEAVFYSRYTQRMGAFDIKLLSHQVGPGDSMESPVFEAHRLEILVTRKSMPVENEIFFRQGWNEVISEVIEEKLEAGNEINFTSIEVAKFAQPPMVTIFAGEKELSAIEPVDRSSFYRDQVSGISTPTYRISVLDLKVPFIYARATVSEDDIVVTLTPQDYFLTQALFSKGEALLRLTPGESTVVKATILGAMLPER